MTEPIRYKRGKMNFALTNNNKSGIVDVYNYGKPALRLFRQYRYETILDSISNGGIFPLLFGLFMFDAGFSLCNGTLAG